MHNMKWSDPLPISQGSAGKMFGESVISRKDSQSVSKASTKTWLLSTDFLKIHPVIAVGSFS